MDWTITELGAAGEFVGAIGVVITLAYLAQQIRQNTFQLEQNQRTARAAAQNATNIALRETRATIYESAEMSRIFVNGNADPGSLDADEQVRYRLATHNITEVMLEIYSQTAVTGFSPETWETQGHTLVARILGTPGGRWFWDGYQDNFPAAFRREVDEILAEEAA